MDFQDLRRTVLRCCSRSEQLQEPCSLHLLLVFLYVVVVISGKSSVLLFFQFLHLGRREAIMPLKTLALLFGKVTAAVVNDADITRNVKVRIGHTLLRQ